MQKPTLLCSAKTDTTTSGKLGRAIGFSTRASRAGVGFYTKLQMYCNWFVLDFTLLSVSIYLFYTFLISADSFEQEVFISELDAFRIMSLSISCTCILVSVFYTTLNKTHKQNKKTKHPFPTATPLDLNLETEVCIPCLNFSLIVSQSFYYLLKSCLKLLDVFKESSQ